jgi:acyl phosphate:glycerol-3-phosphate acyltransferase
MVSALLVITSYLLGSIPFGYIIVRLKNSVDIRETGSGGTGATNVSRRAGKLAGLFTLILDAVKGGLAVVLARWLLTDDYGFNWWVALSALAVLLGHIFPIWLAFRGGKGVATGLGIFLALSPIAVGCAALIFIITVGLTRYVSLGSILAAATFPIWLWILIRSSDRPNESIPLLLSAIASSLLIIIMHHANIKRLILGTENKFS